MNNATKLKLLSWSLVVLVIALATTVWAGESVGGKSLTFYWGFTLLGISAFIIMRAHNNKKGSNKC